MPPPAGAASLLYNNNMENIIAPEYDFTGRATPGDEVVLAEQVAFAKYRAEEDAKKFEVVTEYGSTRFATVAEARRFADFLDEDPRCRAIEIIEL